MKKNKISDKLISTFLVTTAILSLFNLFLIVTSAYTENPVYPVDLASGRLSLYVMPPPDDASANIKLNVLSAEDK